MFQQRTRRLAEFSLSPDGRVPLDEVQEFYALDVQADGLDRPWVWSMSVSSLDGKLGYGDGSLPPAVALSNGPPEAAAGSACDWRLLQAGWALSDAVLISGSCLRSEPATSLRVTQDDLINLRSSKGCSKCRQPMRIVLSGSGNIDPHHLIFKRHKMDDSGEEGEKGPESVTLVATTLKGSAVFQKRLAELNLFVENDLGSSLEEGVSVFKVVEQCSGGSQGDGLFARIKIVTAQKEGEEDGVSHGKILRYLRAHEGVRFLDVSAGGIVIGGLMNEKFIDEVRLTLTGNLLGDAPLLPSLVSFPRDFEASPDSSPLVAYDLVRSLGPHHLFIRGRVVYRH